MALTIVDAHHWEMGENHPEWVNTQGSAPVTDEVASTDSDDGTYSKRLVFAANDNYETKWENVYDSGGATVAVLAQWTLRIDELADFDALYFGILGRGGYTGIEIEQNGSLTTRRISNNNMTTFGFGTTLGASAAGVIPSGEKFVMTMRIVFDDGVGGEIQVKIGEATVLDITGVDTKGGSGSDGVWGVGLYFSSTSSAPTTGLLRVSNFTAAEDDVITALAPQSYTAYTPDGVTADNDGTVFGGAGTADAALDEIPATDTDGITLDAAADAQGLTFPTVAETNINTIQVWGAVGDDAAGSEQMRCDLDDGTATETGTAVSLTADFSSQALTALLDSPPGAASWDAAAADLEATLVRTV